LGGTFFRFQTIFCLQKQKKRLVQEATNLEGRFRNIEIIKTCCKYKIPIVKKQIFNAKYSFFNILGKRGVIALHLSVHRISGGSAAFSSGGFAFVRADLQSARIEYLHLLCAFSGLKILIPALSIGICYALLAD